MVSESAQRVEWRGLSIFLLLVIIEAKTRLSLCTCIRKTTGVLSLMTHHFPFLSFRSLSKNGIGAEGAKAIAEALRVNTTLTTLE